MVDSIRTLLLTTLLAAAAHAWSGDVSSTFTVIQAQGIQLRQGDEVGVRLTIDPSAAGIEGRGMAGSPEIRYAAAVTAMSIKAGNEQFDFAQPLDVIVAPLRNQWTAAYLDLGSGSAPASESESPQLQATTLSFMYPPETLPLDSPIPPAGALTAEELAAPRFGLDLMVRGHSGDRRKGWSIMGRFKSMQTGP